MNDASLEDLPDDVRALIAPHLDSADPSVLAAIGVQIASKRDEAKSARTGSGIESTWMECEEAYLGIDEANRHEFAGAKWAKPMSVEGPVTTTRKPQGGDHKSTAYHRLTTRYVDAGVAKLGEILLPADDKAFSFNEMPVPELIEASKDESQVVHSELGAPLTRPLAPGETPQVNQPVAQPVAAPPTPAAPPVAPGAPPSSPGAPAAPGAQPPATPVGPPRVPLTVKDLAVEKIEMARKKAKAAETRISDWMAQTQYRAEVRKVIADAARIGVGVLKAPTPKSKKVQVVLERDDGSIDLIIKERIVPAAVWVDPWNIYPDPTCGENIHDGDYVFERDFFSARQVRALKKLPGYLTDAIDQVLEEGPNKVNITSGRGPLAKKQNGRFEVWYFHGTLTKDEMRAIELAAGGTPQADQDDGDEDVYVIVTLINDSVVRAVINPLDSGSFPYHSMPWQRRAGSWAGVGVAEQMRTPQKVTNAALRAMLNNAGKSSGSQIIVDQAAIRPADGLWTVTPDKIWYKTNEGTADVRGAFMAVPIPNTTNPLMEIITMGERFAEESTSIPLIAQGQSGATTPDTFGAAQLQNNNANQLLRSIGYAFDDYITEPVVRQYYEWLLLDPHVPVEEKGEFQIDAHGSVALVERAIQDQTIAQMGNMAANAAYGIDPKKWASMFLKSKRLNPDDLTYTKEEQAKIDATPPPEAPAVTVAKIAADTAMKQLAASQQSDQQSQASEERIAAAAHTLETGRVQNEGAQVQAEQQRTQVDATIRLHQIQAERDLAIMQYANQHRISVDAAKVALAKTAMQLNTERTLNAENNQAGDRKHRRQMAQQRNNLPKAPIQVPGRAANGHAFDQSVQ